MIICVFWLSISAGNLLYGSTHNSLFHLVIGTIGIAMWVRVLEDAK